MDVLRRKLSQEAADSVTAVPHKLRTVSQRVTVVQLCSSNWAVLTDFFSSLCFSHSLPFIPPDNRSSAGRCAAGGVSAERQVTTSSSSYTQTNYCSLDPAVSFCKLHQVKLFDSAKF